MSRGKADLVRSPKTQSLSFSTFKCRIHCASGAHGAHRQAVSFHLLKDNEQASWPANHSGHYSLKNLYRVKEEWGYRLCVLPTDAGDDVSSPFQMCLTLRGHLYSCHWSSCFAKFIWLIPTQGDPSSLALVTISWDCYLYCIPFQRVLKTALHLLFQYK